MIGNSKNLDPDVLTEKIERFIASHNTLALAIAGESPRVVPVEYFYHDGNFYIFTEGGKKLENIEKNRNVAFAIYDRYIESLQANAYCTIVDFYSDEYNSICSDKSLDIDGNNSNGNEMYLLRLEVIYYDYLNTLLKKDGYDAHQFKMIRI